MSAFLTWSRIRSRSPRARGTLSFPSASGWPRRSSRRICVRLELTPRRTRQTPSVSSRMTPTGTPRRCSTKHALGLRRSSGARPWRAMSVITGFFGLSREGKTATFGRGGSDYSAAVVAHALELPTIEIWKDVGGFMSADPKIVSEAFPLSALSYDEAAELSYFGAKALHPRSVQPAQACGASIILKNIFRPDETGTRIGPDTVDRSGDVKSISYVRDLATLKVFATGAGQKEGLLSQVATALTSAGTNVYSAATSQTCIALLVDADALSRAKKAVARLPFGLVERIEVLPHVSLISFVGEGLGYAHGVAARVFRAVAERGINVQLISAGASMVAYTFTVDNEDLERAVQAVHREFFGHRYLRPEVPAGSQRQG